MAAETVSSSVTIKLLDDKTEVVLRPLSIKELRRFMKKFEDASDTDSKDFDFMTVLVDCAAIALSKQLPEQTKYLEEEDGDRDAFEDLVDMNIVSKVNEICGGISFDPEKNPNLKAAVEAGQI